MEKRQQGEQGIPILCWPAVNRSDKPKQNGDSAHLNLQTKN